MLSPPSLMVQLVTAAALSATGGCIWCDHAPAVALQEAHFQRAVDERPLLLRAVITVRNCNAFDVVLRGASAEGALHGRRLPRLDTNFDVRVPLGEETAIVMPMALPWKLVEPLLRETIGTPRLELVLVGALHVTASTRLEMHSEGYKIFVNATVARRELVDAVVASMQSPPPVDLANGQES
jgi:hypothetical protein